MAAQATGDSVDAVTLPGQHAIDHPDPHPKEPAIGIGNHCTRPAILGVEVTNPPPRKALPPRLGHVLPHRRQQRLRIKSYGHANIQPHPTPPAFGPGQPTDRDHNAALVLVSTPTPRPRPTHHPMGAASAARTRRGRQPRRGDRMW